SAVCSKRSRTDVRSAWFFTVPVSIEQNGLTTCDLNHRLQREKAYRSVRYSSGALQNARSASWLPDPAQKSRQLDCRHQGFNSDLSQWCCSWQWAPGTRLRRLLRHLNVFGTSRKCNRCG